MSVEPRTVVWFSAGAASAVAAKMAVERGGNVHVVYCDTMATEHPDNRRFFGEVQAWLGCEIQVIRSTEYTDVDDVFERRRYMAGVSGAACTHHLKRVPREKFERWDDTHVFGYTLEEGDRAVDFEEKNPSLHVEWILIDQRITKRDCLNMLAAAGIEMPAMYLLGFKHNNCKGCVKATSPDYWNRTRDHFPDVFERRARQSRLLGVRLVRYKGERIYLDQLPRDAFSLDGDGDIDCGPACQMPLDFGAPTGGGDRP